MRVLIADDNPIVIAGLESLLALEDDIEIVATAQSGPAALALTHQHRPDVVLLDVRMPGGGGLDVLSEIKDVARVLMLTYSEEAAVVSRALRNGATGYLVHGAFDSAELAVAIRDTARGSVRVSPAAAAVLVQGFQEPSPSATVATAPATSSDAVATVDHEPAGELSDTAVKRYRLSRRETEIAELIVSDHSNQEIAQTLFIEEKTVKNHINRLFAKLGAGHRNEAARLLRGRVDQ